MPIIEITSLNHPGVEIFSTLTEAQLRKEHEKAEGIFIAESPKVINVALNAGHMPLAMMCEKRHITGDAADIISRSGDIPVYTGERGLLASLTGYTLTRGVLCAMRRPAEPPVEVVCRDAKRIVVIDGVVDTTNIGAIFRSAAALGIDVEQVGIKGNIDSLGRIHILEQLHTLGFKTAAMALTDDSISIDNPVLTTLPKLAIVMGTEGDGLPAETIAKATHVVRIPMSHNVDSLNVAAAAAVAFWELRSR